MMEEEKREAEAEEEEEEELSMFRPDINLEELMKLYENVTDDEKSTTKDKVYAGWSSFKIEFIGMMAYVTELYINDTIPLYLLKRIIKIINRVRQCNQVLEENVKKMEENASFPYLLNVEEEEFKHLAISHRGEILQQWTHFSNMLVAFEKVLEERVGEGNATWKAYMLLMDEAAFFESELASYLLSTTNLTKPALFMQATYVKGGFEENEEKDDFTTRIKALKMNEMRVVRLKKENQARRESKKVKTEEEKREGVLKRRKELKLVIPKKKIKKEAPHIVVDEVEARTKEMLKQQELLNTFFMESLAAEVDKKIQYLASMDCSGCAVMSLTQDDHDVCMMMSSPHKFEVYFSKAVNLVAFNTVFKEWYERVQKEVIPPLSKEEMAAYEVNDNPLERFTTIKGNPKELEAFKDYVKSIYPSYK